MSAVASNAMARPNLLSVLRVRNFALLWSGQAISQIGDALFNVAMMWLVLQLTGSALAMGTTVILTQLPRLAFQLIGGVSVDRYDRRILMLLSDVLRGIVMLAFALLVATDQIQLIHVYILSIIFGIVSAFFYPAMSALIPNLVAQDELIAANSLSMLTQQGSQIIGPAIAGVLIAIPAIGIAGVSFFNAFSFGVGVLALLLMQLPAHLNGTRKTNGSFVHELKDGFRYLFGFRALVVIIFLAMVLNFALAPVSVILPIFVKNVLDLGSESFGFIMSAFGVGMVAGSIAVGVRPPRAHRGIIVFLLTTLQGVLFAMVGLVPIFVISCVLSLVIGFANGIVNTMLSAMLQGMIADEYRGRIFGLMSMISMGMMPISLAIAGGITDLVGSAIMFVAGGVLCAVASLYGMTFREIREL
ncbi:MAG: MFS transporter [Chloroflexi bacterium]|nr:MFS transporter [Chloroflexota bacterium]